MESENANEVKLKIFDFEQNTVDPNVSPEYTTSCCALFIAEEIAEFSGCQNLFGRASDLWRDRLLACRRTWARIGAGDGALPQYLLGEKGFPTDLATVVCAEELMEHLLTHTPPFSVACTAPKKDKPKGTTIAVDNTFGIFVGRQVFVVDSHRHSRGQEGMCLAMTEEVDFVALSKWVFNVFLPLSGCAVDHPDLCFHEVKAHASSAESTPTQDASGSAAIGGAVPSASQDDGAPTIGAAANVWKMRRIRVKSRGQLFPVTHSAAGVIGRITDEATAGEVFTERVRSEAQEYLSQVREATVRRACAAAGWECMLCPFKSLAKVNHLAAHVTKQHEGGMKHPIRNFVNFSRHLFDSCTSKPAPWDLLKPGGASGVCRRAHSGWKALVRERPLADTARAVRAWNTGVNRPEALKRGWYREDFRSLITEKGGRLLLRNHPEHVCARCASLRILLSLRGISVLTSVRTRAPRAGTAAAISEAAYAGARAGLHRRHSFCAARGGLRPDPAARGRCRAHRTAGQGARGQRQGALAPRGREGTQGTRGAGSRHLFLVPTERRRLRSTSSCARANIPVQEVEFVGTARTEEGRRTVQEVEAG
ncbi:unnamed protein product [Prorocentrum cordatum]|uniref:C2H2-type domain-containing protein n=1 Tax=Prorocentrum cordatum TaxID=2364126 RepID=A0ABN9VZR3_9DINO|nr:unnamed protein product [Polarella glacialis]